MKSRVAGGLMISGSLLICVFSLAQNQEGQRPEHGHLIDSVKGAVLFKAYCAVCHGKDGKGAGPMAKSLKTSPPDLTRIAARNAGKFPLERVEKIIAGDEPIPAGHGSREMPVWGPIFSQVAWDQDLGRLRVYNLARYLESLQAR